MFPHLEERLSDSPFIERVWRTESDAAGSFTSIATVFWSIVVSKRRGRISISIHGPETAATRKEHPSELEWFGIMFKIGTYVPALPPSALVDGCLVLPASSARGFSLGHTHLGVPEFETAEPFVDRMVRAGILAREPVASPCPRGRSEPPSVRTVQHRFQRSTGLSRRAVRQIERARHAAALLTNGVSILDTVDAAGYSDQPHLTRSMKRFIGLTPAAIPSTPIVALHPSP